MLWHCRKLAALIPSSSRLPDLGRSWWLLLLLGDCWLHRLPPCRGLPVLLLLLLLLLCCKLPTPMRLPSSRMLLPLDLSLGAKLWGQRLASLPPHGRLGRLLQSLLLLLLLPPGLSRPQRHSVAVLGMLRCCCCCRRCCGQITLRSPAASLAAAPAG